MTQHTLQRLSPATVNGHTIHLQHSHRPTLDPPLVTVAATVELTHEEVTAVLFDWIDNGGHLDELHDDNRVRLLVAESVINGGCLRVDELRDAAWTLRGMELLKECQRRALAVFGDYALTGA